MILPKKGLLVARLLVLAALASVPNLRAPVLAAGADRVSGVAAVARAASTGKPVRVIATLDIPAGPQGTVSRPVASRAAESLRTRLASSGVGKVEPIGGTPFVVLEVNAAQLQALVASGLVTAVREDAVLKPQLAQSVPLIDAPAAWGAGARGAGWAVAILDTGVQADHPFLAGRVVEEACFSSASAYSTTACPNGQGSQTGAGAAAPCSAAGCYHGTHVAGIAAGRAFAGGPSYSGVAPDADIIAVQIFSNFTADYCGGSPCALAYTSDIVRGLQYVLGLAATRQIASANMSLGGGSYTAACDSDPTKSSIDQLLAAGVATVISAGNDGTPNAISSPGCISTAVTVGATYDTGSQGVTSYSNSGAMLDLLAPGSIITSSLPGSTFGDLQGTSMAAPHVTGAYAVLRSASPARGPGAIEQALEATGKPILDARNNLARPRIDVDAACVKLGACGGSSVPQPGWQAWASRGGPIDSGPFCAPVGAGVQCWARTPGSFHLLWFMSADGDAWQAPVDLGGTFGPDGVWCLVRGSRIDCGGASTAGHFLTVATTDGTSWAAVQDHGGAVKDQPSCLAPLGEAIAYECYAIGADSALYRFAFDGARWAAAKKIAGATGTGRPDCYARTGAAECFLADSTGSLKLVRVTRGVAGPVAKIATGFKAAPHCLPSGGVVDCFGQNSARHLAKGYYDGKKWAAFADLGGSVATVPYCDRDGANVDCFYLNPLGHLIQRQRAGQTWQPEADIAALPTNAPSALLQQRPFCPSRNDGARIDCLGRGAADGKLWQKTFK